MKAHTYYIIFGRPPMEASPPSPRAAPLSGRKTTTQKSINQLELRYVMLSVCFYRTYLLTHVT